MNKMVKNGHWVAGSLSLLTGVFELVDRYMTLEYQDRQSRRLHAEATLEISERASIIRAKIEADARNFNSRLESTEKQLEIDNNSFAQVQTLLIDTIRETSDTSSKLHLIDKLAATHKSFLEHKSGLMTAIIENTPDWQLLGSGERKLVTGND